ncbi:MAG TPA: MFS transporter [Nocardioides sp.]|uniref:MFS transporter n=1 Tax=Nocardioides sp. TaxID=35761 RepID=UPI002ED9BC01
MTPTRRPAGSALLALAATAVCFAAADTYVVVLALPDIMRGVGLSVEELQRAAPIISAFLLGYVAMLPLIGRIADVRGRPPVLVAGLVVFAFGSLVTALAVDLPMMVTGRFLQGLGGGALVPATLALVADLYPVERRGVPLGVVSAVQELGSVLGPLLGAAVLAVADWRVIFLLNLVVGAVLAVLVHRAAASDAIRWSSSERQPSPRWSSSDHQPSPRWSSSERQRASSRPPDLVGILLLAVTLAAGTLMSARPTAIVTDVEWGRLYVPAAGSSLWTTPLGLLTALAGVLFLAWCWLARRPLVDLRGWAASARQADLTGATYLAVALGGVVLAFATADPKVQVISAQGGWYLLAAAVAALAFAVHLRRAEHPLVPVGALRRTPAWGSVVVSFLVGAALVAALIDIPLFARTTVHSESQLQAALVLVRFLVALPVGAVLGGVLIRRLPAGPVAAVGMACAAVAFWQMSGWDLTTLEHWSANGPLLLGGLGFGLALAPVNAAVLATTDAAVHGLAGAMVVVARMVGMLVGIAALTTIGLRRYYAEQADLPPAREVCDGLTRCDAFTELIRTAGIAQEQAVFSGAAVVALLAAVLAVMLLRGAPTRDVDTREALGALGG